MDESRRAFLKTAGCAILGAGLAAPITRAVAGAVSADAMPGALTAGRWAIAVNVRKCLQREDCRACIDACHAAHNVPVMMDQHGCIGGRYCIVGCPYGSRSFNWQDPRPFITTGIKPEYPTRMKGVVAKCTVCPERRASGLPPAS